MNCPYCSNHDSKVIDSREASEGIRRRRQCLNCGARFTTYERPQLVSFFVIKKDKRREEFNRNKLLSGIRKACEKRPLPAGMVEQLVDNIENNLHEMGKAEVSSTIIGDMVIDKLKNLDYIAYIRFASVYREFADITALKQEVDTLISQKIPLPTSQLPLLPNQKLPVPSRSRRRSRK